MQVGSNVVSTRSKNGKSPFDSLNSLYLNTKGMFLAGNRSRQQRRPSSSGTQEENAARRRFSRDETQKILRKAIRKSDAGTGRSDPPSPQACSQEGPTRGTYRCTARKEGAAWQADRTWPILGRERSSASTVMARYISRDGWRYFEPSGCVSSVLSSCRAGAKVESLPH